VQVILEGSELGGSSTILTILDGVSGPVILSTLVRVSVRQSVLPCFRHAIRRTVGYNDSIVDVRDDAELGVMPAEDNSVEQPFVMFWTTAERVSLLHAGEPHMLVSQLLKGWTTEVLAPAVITVMRAPIARHWDAAELAAIDVRAEAHCWLTDCAVT